MLKSSWRSWEAVEENWGETLENLVFVVYIAITMQETVQKSFQKQWGNLIFVLNTCKLKTN